MNRFVLGRLMARLDSWACPVADDFPQSTAAFVLAVLRPYVGFLAASVLLSAGSTLLELYLLAYAASLIEMVTASGSTRNLSESVWGLSLAAFILVVGRPVVDGVAFLMSAWLFEPLAAMHIRRSGYRRLRRQSMAFFSDQSAGALTDKVLRLPNSLLAFVETVTHELLSLAIIFAGSIGLLWSVDWRLGLVVAVWIAATTTWSIHLVPEVMRSSEFRSEASADMYGAVTDGFANIATFKLFGGGADDKIVANRIREHTYAVIRLKTMTFALYYGTMAANGVFQFTTIALAVVIWQNGGGSVGDVALALTLALRIAALTHEVGWKVNDIFENWGDIRSSASTLTEPVAVQDRSDAVNLELFPAGIRFENVNFRYGRPPEMSTGLALSGITLDIAPGEKIGLVGPSGAGKSTLVNVLLRLYDLQSGRILIDGQDIAGVRQDSLRAAVGVVTQDTSLLHRSIRDNITYGRPEADEAALVTAARQAKADAFIADLIDARGRRGYDAHVGERGVKLSGGQRQRIAIARVLLKNAPILVLDEATSALDSDVEAAIQESLDDLMAGKTVIAIAHRLSTIARMDRLVVMDRGRIVEVGTHHDLVAKGGLYAGLWARQTGGFLDMSDGVAPVIEPADA